MVEALARGEGGDVPLLAMSTTHEFIGAAFGLFGLVEELGGRTAVEVMEEAGLGAGPAADYVAAHPELGGGERLYLGCLISDAMFHIPLLGWARARERAGSAGTWLSRFAWESPATGLSTHCLDLPFAFDCLAHPYCDHTLRAVPPQSLADAVERGAPLLTRANPLWQCAHCFYGLLYYDSLVPFARSCAVLTGMAGLFLAIALIRARRMSHEHL